MLDVLSFEGWSLLLRLGCLWRPRDKKITIFDQKKIGKIFNYIFSIFGQIQFTWSPIRIHLKCRIRIQIPIQWIRIHNTGLIDSFLLCNHFRLCCWAVSNPFVMSGNLRGGSVVASYPFDDNTSHIYPPCINHFPSTVDQCQTRSCCLATCTVAQWWPAIPSTTVRHTYFRYVLTISPLLLTSVEPVRAVWQPARWLSGGQLSLRRQCFTHVHLFIYYYLFYF